MHFTVRNLINHQSKPGPFTTKIDQTQKQSVNSQLPILLLHHNICRIFSMKSFITCLSFSNPAFTGKIPLNPPFPRDCVAIGKMGKNVMLNLFQHLMESINYETLKRVQGDKK